MTWVLIILAYASTGSYENKGVAVDHISGFKSKAACEAAAEQIPEGVYSPSVRTSCVKQ